MWYDTTHTFYNGIFKFQRILSEVQAAPSPHPSPAGSPQLRRKLAHTVSLPVESFGHYLSSMGIQAQSKDNVGNNDAQKTVHTAIILHEAKNRNSP